MNYTFEVAGIPYTNKDGEERKDIIKTYLKPDEVENPKAKFEFKRHGGNRYDRNAVGIYMSTNGFFGAKEQMIGFIERDLAKEISPMLKAGHSIIEAKITRLWLPSLSEKASPCVTLSITTSWTTEDRDKVLNDIKNKQKEQRMARKNKQTTISETKKHRLSGLLKSLFGFILR